jgi:hypothetical protein
MEVCGQFQTPATLSPVAILREVVCVPEPVGRYGKEKVYPSVRPQILKDNPLRNCERSGSIKAGNVLTF